MYDYHGYGSFKAAFASPVAEKIRLITNFLGIRNRYIRFLDGLRKSDSILEIGCGDGSFMKALKNVGYENVIGIDPSPTYSAVDPSLSIFQTDAISFFGDKSHGPFDAILMLDVIEHISPENLSFLVSLLHDNLSDSGFVVIRTPNMASPLALRNYFGDLSHVCPLNQDSIRQLFFGSGFKRIRFAPEPFHYPRGVMALIGIVLWPPALFIFKSLYSAFGVNKLVLTPNLMVILRKN